MRKVRIYGRLAVASLTVSAAVVPAAVSAVAQEAQPGVQAGGESGAVSETQPGVEAPVESSDGADGADVVAEPQPGTQAPAPHGEAPEQPEQEVPDQAAPVTQPGVPAQGEAPVEQEAPVPQPGPGEPVVQPGTEVPAEPVAGEPVAEEPAPAPVAEQPVYEPVSDQQSTVIEQPAPADADAPAGDGEQVPVVQPESVVEPAAVEQASGAPVAPGQQAPVEAAESPQVTGVSAQWQTTDSSGQATAGVDGHVEASGEVFGADVELHAGHTVSGGYEVSVPAGRVEVPADVVATGQQVGQIAWGLTPVGVQDAVTTVNQAAHDAVVAGPETMTFPMPGGSASVTVHQTV